MSTTLTPTAEGYQKLATIPNLSHTNLDVLKQYATPAPAATDTTTVNGVAIPTGILPISFPNFQNAYNWVASVDTNIRPIDQLRFRYL